MSNPQELIQRLYNLGHFHNPETQQGVELSDLRKLTLSDDVVRRALASFQAFMKPDLDMFAEIHHARAAEADGLMGPATEDLFEFPRCGFPDYPVPGLALNDAPLEANWPTACRGRLRFGRDFKALPGSNEAATHGAMWASANNWSWALEDLDMVAANVGETNVQRYARLEALSGSTLAWSYLAQNNCNANLAQRYNTRTNWANQVFAATVISHEDGHALGLPHNNDRSALMYPSIHAQSQARAGYPNQTDLNGCRAIGYKISANGTTPPPRDKLFTPRPWGGPTDPTDPTDPKPGTVYISGVNEVRRSDTHEVLGRFIFVPEPRI